MAWFWQALLASLQVQVCLSSAHHLETDGGSEQMNTVLEQYLRCFLNFQQDNWMDLLALAEFAYNNSQHACTQITLFLANYGFHL